MELKVGDYVRWYYPTCKTWVEGELVEYDPRQWTAAIRADPEHTNLKNPGDGVYRVGTTSPSALKRIERPSAAAEAQVAMLKPTRSWRTDQTGKPQMHWECLECGICWGAHYGSRCPEELICDRRPEIAINPLDIEYDGLTLRDLLDTDQWARFGEAGSRGERRAFTPAQRSAVSAHWSAELLRKVAESAAEEHNRVRVDIQDVDDL